MSTTELIFNNTKFYPMNENTDGSISFNGQTYEIGDLGSSLYNVQKQIEAIKGKHEYYFSIALSTPLTSDPTPTVNDLTNKGEKIRLAIIGTTNDGSIEILVSRTIDLSKPDSNGHFNFNWSDYDSTYAYCWLSNGNFLLMSDGIDYGEYQNWFLQIYYAS